MRFRHTIDFLVTPMRRMSLARRNKAGRLEEARDELHDKNTVCFLGEVKSGKTVSSSLLKHALFNHFVPNHADDYQAIVSHGMDTINRSLGDMIIHREFPASTLPVSDPQVVLNVYKMSGIGAGKIEIILRDSSGEHFFTHLIKESIDSGDRLYNVLNSYHGPDKVGPLAHYIFAKLYILTVDCSDVASLAHKQSLLANAIVTLNKLHAAAKLTHNQKIDCPIAILFTKADLLNGNDADQPAKKLLEHMPELKSALDVKHGGALACFKVSISTHVESEHDKDKRVRRQKQLYDEEYAKVARLRRDVEEKISAECDRERKKMERDLGEADLEAHLSEYEEKLRNRLNPIPLPKEFDEEKVRKEQSYRPISPLTYTHDEYVKLIMWVISKLVGSR